MFFRKKDNFMRLFFLIGSFASLGNTFQGMQPDYQKVFGAGVNKKVNFDERDDKILDELQKKGLLSGEVTHKEAIHLNPGDASNAFRILFFKMNKKDYVVKVCERDGKDYNRENILIKDKTIDNSKKIINNYEKKYAVKLPLLTDYYATIKTEDGLFLTLMQRATGQSLNDIRQHLYSEGRLFTKNQQYLPSEDDMITMGHAIGEQMGCLTRAFFENNQSILLHGDPQGQNFLYDPVLKQLSWIDLAGTREVKYTDIHNFIESEFDLIKSIWWSLFPFGKKNELTTGIWDPQAEKHISLADLVKEKGLNVMKGHRLGILAGDAFFKAYTERLEDTKLSKYWNDTWEKNGHNSFYATINEFKNDYINLIKKAFGDDSDKVLSYLFPYLPKKNIENAEIKELIEISYGKMKDDIQDFLFEKVKYNDYKLNNYMHYTNNMALLNQEKTKILILNYISEIIEKKKQAIESKLMFKDADPLAVDKTLKSIKDQIFEKIYHYLVNQNDGDPYERANKVKYR